MLHSHMQSHHLLAGRSAATRPCLRPLAPPCLSRGRLVIRSAMFDSLSRSMQKAWKMVSKEDKLTEENMKVPLKEVRRALLEADVSLPVVRRFVKKVEQKALGQEVIVGVTPDMAFIKTVNDELVELMGSKGAKDLEQGFPQVILMAGLQGVGKTTACGKLALHLMKLKKKVLMVATDVYRPAAIDQLQKLGQSINVPVFEMGTSASPVEIARAGVEEGKRMKVDAVIVDTAGRLQVDDEMMQELKDTKASIKPTDTLLVVDAMTGQEAANLVKAFNDQANITGAILTKMDGDARGGAALSVKEVSGKPIKFVGTGEKMESLEPFYPERMASRILGQGDVLSLYEKAEQAIKAEDAEANLKRLMSNKFDFNDFLTQFKTMNNMGGAQIMKLMPGMNKISERQLYEMEKELKKYESMINVMQDEERATPEILAKSAARRRRIAQASGRSEADVSNLMAKFAAVRAQVSKMSQMMQLGSPGGAQNEQLMKELIESSQRQVAPGKARVKREKSKSPPLPKTKGFGFAAKK